MGSWNPKSTICPFRARKWPFQAPKTLRFKGRIANFETKNTIKQGKKRQKDKWYPFHACTPPPPKNAFWPKRRGGCTFFFSLESSLGDHNTSRQSETGASHDRTLCLRAVSGSHCRWQALCPCRVWLRVCLLPSHPPSLPLYPSTSLSLLLHSYDDDDDDDNDDDLGPAKTYILRGTPWTYAIRTRPVTDN